MNEQTRAMTAEAAAERGAAAAPGDAWDRLAALAFGDAASAGGCSEHAHDCTCLAENAAAGQSVGPEHESPPPTPGPDADEELETAD